jgi:hypothetical protein
MLTSKKLRCVRSIGAAFALSALGACGGGSGDGGGGNTTPSVMPNVTSISIQAKVTDASAGPSSVTVTASNVPSGGLFVRASATSNGISTLSPGTFSGTSGQVQIYYKAPYTLAPATYSDSVQIQVCPDSSCASQVSGSPISVSVKYTIAAVTGAAAPTISTSLGPLFAQALPTDTVTPAAPSGGITITNPPSFSLNLKLASTSTGLQSAVLQQPLNKLVDGSVAATIDIAYRAPNALASGVYQDSITVTACLDAACVNPIQGSPIVIQSTYQIGNSVPGPNGYTVNTVGLQANDLVWDPTHSVIYASAAAASTSHPNSVVAIDPVTGAIAGSVSLTGEPGRLAISDDATELYVALRTAGSIQRISLPSLTPDLSVALPSIAALGQLYAYDLAVVPGSPRSVAVTLLNGQWPSTDFNFNDGGVVIFDDATMRPQEVNIFSSTSSSGGTTFIGWGATSTTLYGSGSAGLESFVANTQGLSLGTLAVPGINGLVQYLNGMIYCGNGQAVNLSTGAVGGLPSNVYRQRAIADGTLSRMFSLDVSGAYSAIGIYNLSSFAAIKSIQVLGVPIGLYDVPAFISWGTNGLAYAGSNGQIVILSGAYLGN